MHFGIYYWYRNCPYILDGGDDACHVAKSSTSLQNKMEETPEELSVYVPGSDPEIDALLAELERDIEERIAIATAKRDEIAELYDRIKDLRIDHMEESAQFVNKMTNVVTDSGASLTLTAAHLLPLEELEPSQEYRQKRWAEITKDTGLDSDSFLGDAISREPSIGSELDGMDSGQLAALISNSVEPNHTMEPDDLEIGSKRRRVSMNKKKEHVCDADIAEYQWLCQQYKALPNKLVALNVDSTKWSCYKTTHETSALPICLICNKPFNDLSSFTV